MAEDNPSLYPPDRRSARLQGSLKYFTGKPCPRQHTAPRYTSYGGCVACKAPDPMAIRQREWQSGPCSVEGCGRKADTRSLCHAHFERLRKTGDLSAAVPIAGRVRLPPGSKCQIEGCERGGRLTQGMCAPHYYRWSKFGDPLVEPAPRPSACSVDGCEKPPVARGLCDAHYSKLLRRGDPAASPKRKVNSEVTYFAMHTRLRKARGSAAAYQCVRCERTAANWAWIHGEDPADFDSYAPMCLSCHRKYDLTDETREKLSRSVKASWTPERRAAQAERMRRRSAAQNNAPSAASR